MAEQYRDEAVRVAFIGVGKWAEFPCRGHPKEPPRGNCRLLVEE